ncbi:hypothetical protein O181_027006 [Austropuccinia psidii MF-1]|uniref:Uncharacterized protein n=1 Tax=Austropuccinia psidii MF-1 TaxID=1389203 RepID=A0A9Q3CLH6_9BASI|nr:hypothetical protein [Austropuccinia psidii MF-1]
MAEGSQASEDSHQSAMADLWLASGAANLGYPQTYSSAISPRLSMSGVLEGLLDHGGRRAMSGVEKIIWQRRTAIESRAKAHWR